MVRALLSNNLVETLGWTLLHSLWQGLLIFVFLVPILVALKKHKPQLRYNLLCLALLLLLSGMITTFWIYLPTSSSALVFAVENPMELASPISTQDLLPMGLEVSTNHSFQQSIRQFIQLYAHHLVGIWLIGFLFFALRWMSRVYFTYQLKKLNTIPVESDWKYFLEEWQAKLGIRKGIELFESAKVDVPLIIGHLKPIILLPIGTISGLTPAQIEAIIIHEMAHIKRNDFLINLLLSSLEMILFYHPVFWWIANQIEQEREKCCDDIAVAACGNPKLYARTLLIMEEKRQQNLLAMAYQGKKNHLLDRIKRICIATPASYRPEFGKAGLSLFLLFIIAAVSWAKMPEKMTKEELITPAEEISKVSALPASEELFTEATTLENFPKENKTISITPIRSLSFIPVSQKRTGMEAIRQNEVPQDASNIAKLPTSTSLVPNAPKLFFNSLLGRDTIPYTIEIPKMEQQPKLPPVPNFTYSLEKIESEINKNPKDRKFLRSVIADYQENIGEWRSQVRREYLRPWSYWQGKVEDIYYEWKNKIKSQSNGDDIAYAIAIKKGTKQFEKAIKLQERAIKESEDIIKDELESYIRSVERLIRNQEKKQDNRDDRLAVHDDRMRVHDLRMSVHDSRMSIHDERMSIHDIRMRFHDSRMQAHDILMKAFKEELFTALEADGLAKREAKRFSFVARDGQVEVNGMQLNAQQSLKYLTMLEKYGFEIGPGHQFEMIFGPKHSRIGTSYYKSEN